jgi:ribonuclease BN (tRNA processing enzyme)
MELKFLGTGGGRYVTGMQRRKTGGILLKTEETQVHIDPGPGALVNTHEMDDPDETEAVLVSHSHLDHANDANAIIEMMVEAYDKKGILIANETALEGYGDVENFVSNYHRGICGRVEEVGDGDTVKFKDLEFEFQQMFHSDPKTVGFTAETEEKKIGFWIDTEFSEELLEFYEGCDTLVVYCSRPKGEKVSSHIALDDVPDIVEATEPDTVIVTHFGYRFLDSDMEEQEEWLDEQVEAKVVFSDDGMKFPGNRSLDAF